jgi:hypothetical protein
MAYTFTSASSQSLSATSTILKSQSKLTLAGWVYRNATGTTQVFGSSKNGNNRFAIYAYIDNNIYWIANNGGNGFGTSATPAGGAWHHFCQVFDGTQTGNANRLKGYLNGTQVTLGFVGTVQSATSSNVDIEAFTINYAQSTPEYGNGRYCEIGVWHEALTAAEIASLAKGMTCDKVRPQSLVFYAPLVRNLNDQKGGRVITNNNGATVANHPRVYA